MMMCTFNPAFSGENKSGKISELKDNPASVVCLRTPH